MTLLSVRRLCLVATALGLLPWGVTGCRRKLQVVRPVSAVVEQVKADAAGPADARSAGSPPPLPEPNLDEVGLAALPTPSGDPTLEAWLGRFGTLPPGQRSRSVGTPQNGWLQGGVALHSSDVLRVVPQTLARGYFFGTEDLVRLLQGSAVAVASRWPGSRLRVANLSRQGGGDIGPSVSHNSGRDADVLFFAYERRHEQGEPDNFTHYDALGIADAPATAKGRYEFDTERNWALVKYWLSNPDVQVQWIFISVPLRNRLLDYALRLGEPASLRRTAARVLVQPRDSSPHADHFHLRIACPPGDRPACIDGGRVPVLARDAQVDALLDMYHHGTPAEQRYARELLSLPADGMDAELPPIEGADEEESPP